MLTQERLKELLKYDPETGLFTRKLKQCNAVNIGDIAGWISKQGYITMSVDNKEYRAHRLAWYYINGDWPEKDIDHINGIRTDNRFYNLRLANRSENNQNQTKARSNNITSGLLGVSLHKIKNKFRARIQLNGKQMSLGYYKTKEEAYQAYLEAKREIHPFGML